MAVRLTRQGVQVAQQGETQRVTRVSVQVAAVPIPPAIQRLTRMSAQAAQQPPAGLRTTRLAVQVAVGSLTDDNVRGIRRAGIIHHRLTSDTPRT